MKRIIVADRTIAPWREVRLLDRTLLNGKIFQGPVADICSRMRYLKDNAKDSDNEIVYFETTQDELVSPCNADWDSALMSSMGDIVDLIKTGINPNVY